MKKNILESLCIFLLKKGFIVKTLHGSCFDIIARNKETILLLKVLEDANSINKVFANEMNKISSYISSSPLLIAEKANNNLEDNIIYNRLNIFTLNFQTFCNCIEHKFPFVKKTQAGYTLSIIGKKLRENRERLGYSLSFLSKKIGVSSRMIAKYENEVSEITLNNALKIYNIFGNEVFAVIDIFSNNYPIESTHDTDISAKYIDLGFNATDTIKSPFDIIAKREKELIFTNLGDNLNPEAKSLSEMLMADNLIIFEKKKPKNIPAVTKEEFFEFEKANELIKFLKEF